MTLPSELTNSLVSGNVIPFVGAGVSMAVTHRNTGEKLFPSWKELLERAAELIRLDNEAGATCIRYFASQGRFLDATKEAEKLMGRVGLSEFLRGQFKVKRDDICPRSLALAQSIWQLGCNFAITTNYDNILPWAHENSHDVTQWKTTALSEHARSVRELPIEPTVWHLHGHIDDIHNLILTEENYRRLYDPSTGGESEYDAAREVLKAHLTARTFLFIGYSMDDYPFVEQLQSLQRLYKGHSASHYVMLRECEIERFLAKGLNVKVVPYSNHGEPLLKLISELATSVTSSETPMLVGASSIPASGSAADFSPQKRAWNIPYGKKGKKVIGRDEALARVRKQLQEGSRTAIGQTAAFEGIGGLGKTQMAIEYAWEFREVYPAGVVWLNADQEIAPQISAMAFKSGWVSPQSEPQIVYEMALQRLRTFNDGLVIFDNIERIESINAYLPEADVKVHILITSRDEQPGFSPVKLELLNPEQAETMLVQESGRMPLSYDENVALRHIVDVLDGLPLALELVGAFMRRRENINWVQYAKLLDESVKEVFDRAARFNGTSFTTHHTDLFATLRLSETLVRETPLLCEILHVLAWSGSASMGIDLLRSLLGEPSMPELLDALGLGVNLRLLKLENGERYGVHRLIRQVQREEHRLCDHEVWAMDIMDHLGNWFERHRKDFADLAIFEADIDHLEAWLSQFSEQNSTRAVRLLWLQAYPPFHRGEYRKSQEWLRVALERFSAQGIESGDLYAHLLNDCGAILGRLGDPVMALEYHKRSLAMRLELIGERSADTVMSLNNVGSGLSQIGEHHSALEHLEKALSICLDALGEYHPYTAMTFNNLGGVHGAIHNYTKALNLRLKALPLYVRIHGDVHPATAGVLNNLGGDYGSLGNHLKALEYQKRSLEILQDLLGCRHPETAFALDSIAATYCELKNYEFALNCRQQSLSICTEVLGKIHPKTAQALCNLGNTYRAAAEYDDALLYGARSLEVWKDLEGEDSLGFATSLNNIGVTYFTLKRYKEAAEIQSRAFEIRSAISGIHHPESLTYARNCAGALACLGQGLSKALPLLYRILKGLPSKHPQYCELKKLKDDISRGKFKQKGDRGKI